MRREAARAALLGAGIPAAQAGQAPRQPPLLPAPGRAGDPPDPRLLYDQGFTIGGARNRLEGEEAREDVTQTHQLARQLRVELEELIKILRR